MGAVHTCTCGKCRCALYAGLALQSYQLLVGHVLEGLAEHIPYEGVRVTSLKQEEIAELYVLRLLIEPVAIRLAVPRIGEKKLQALSAIVESAAELLDESETAQRRELNRKFHKDIFAECNKPTLQRFCEIVWNRFPGRVLYEGIFRRPNAIETYFDQEVRDHRGLLDAIACRDAERAEQLPIRHIRRYLSDLEDLLGISATILEEEQRRLWPVLR